MKKLLCVIAKDTFLGEEYDTGVRIPGDSTVVEVTLRHLYRASTATEFYTVERIPESITS